MVYLRTVLVLLFCIYAFKTYINCRQWLRFKRTAMNEALSELITEESFKKSQNYGFDKLSFDMLTEYLGTIEEILTLCFGIIPLMWNFGSSIGRAYLWESETVKVVIFLLITTVLEKAKSLPIELYSTFVLEERYGFNKTTYEEFIKDEIKGLILGTSIKIFLLLGILWIIDWAGPNFYFYVWIFLTVFTLVFSHLYHDYIAPIFNTFTELDEGDLKEAINELAGRVKFPLKKVFVIDGSRRSDHSNAYFFGFWKNKRIVLFDTLLNPEKKMKKEEILAILAHEIGHWSENHFLKRLLILEVNIFVVFYCFQFVLNNNEILRDFGFEDNSPFLSLIVFSYFINPLMYLLQIAMVYYSRIHEFQADAFSKKLDFAADLKSGLIKLFTQNSGNVDPDPLYSTIKFSHPPLLERINAL